MAKIRKIYDDAIKPDGSKQVIYPVTSTRAVYTTSNVTLDKVLSEGYRFGGIVLPTDSPSITDQRVFYGASVPGVYTSFGNIAVDSGEAIFLLYDGEHWEKGIFGGAGYSTLTGFKALASIQDLPKEETQFGYLINGHLYVWVGENGDTLDGLYLDCGELRGASAYEVAVRNGYRGTEQEWLNDPIHGIKGISVKSVECIHEALEDGGTNIWRITLTNGNSTDFEVKNGNQGNSGYQGAAGELEVVNNLTDGGATAALSAEMGKAIVDLYGTYVDNPEFVKVWLDKEDRILMAIRNDGDIYFGVGTPSQVKAYIEERIDDLGLQDYEKLVNFVGELIDSPKTLSELFADVNAATDTKVDKEEGKSLIDSEHADAASNIDNPEYLQVTTDSEDKILEGIQVDGTKVIGGDLNVRGSTNINGDIRVLGNMELSGVSYKVIENPEWIKVLTDAQDRIIAGVRKDGSVYIGQLEGLDDKLQEMLTQMQQMLDEAEAEIDAKLEVFNSVFNIVDNPEWIQVTTDAEGKILEGITSEGKKKVMVETEIEGVNVKDISEDINGLKKEVYLLSNKDNIIYKNILSKGDIEYYDISQLGLYIYIHISNFSKYACKLPINFYDENKNYIGQALVDYRGTDEFYEENVKYGRVYVKSGEDSTLLIVNPYNYKYIGFVTEFMNNEMFISLEICNKSYGLSLEKTSVSMPFLGCGKLYIQPKNFNYSHCARLANIGKYLLVCFCAAQRDSFADSNYTTQFETLAIVEKGNYNNIVYKIFDGSPNDSALYEWGNANNRICPKENDLYILYYAYDSRQSPVTTYLKKFDTLTFEFSEPIKTYLHYNNTTVEWTKENELVMYNVLYNAGLEVVEHGLTEVGDMRYYNGYFYIIVGGQAGHNDDVSKKPFPWTLLKSSDCIIWEPVSCIYSEAASAELVFDICNDIILIQIRANGSFNVTDYNGYMVCDINGNMLKEPTYLSSVDSKGSVFVKEDTLYIVYNVESSDRHYFKRNKIAIAKLNTDYSLTVLKEYSDMNGYQYFDFNCKDNIVFMANTEDPRGYNYDANVGPYGGGVSIAIVNEEVFKSENN